MTVGSGRLSPSHLRSSSSASTRGSVISPRSALAAAVSGEHSQTLSSAPPPERPGKLRGKVRSELVPGAGA